MQIFEFQFNPRKKACRVETLSYKSQIDSQNLYLAGEMKNIVPGKEKFLIKIMKMIKNEYSLQNSKSPENALKKSLIKVNEYLSGEIAKNNVNWLGNVHLAVISVSGNNINIAKIGNVDIFLINYGKLKKLDGKVKNITLSNNNFRPKIFNTIISGKIKKDERISIATKEPMIIFKQEKTLEKISKLPFLDKKIMEDIINSMKKNLLKVSGVFFLLDTKELPKDKKPFISENEIDFSLKEIIYSVKNFIEKLSSKKKNISLPHIKLLKIKKIEVLKKELVLVLLFVIVLITGFIIFQN